MLSHVFAPVIAGGYPFIAVHGNHDEEGSWTREAYMNFTLSQPGAIGTIAVDGVKGVNNHVIQVEASGSTDTAFNIWMFDSGDYSKVENVPGYDWIALSQIEWYHETALSIQRDAGVCVCVLFSWLLPCAFAFLHKF